MMQDGALDDMLSSRFLMEMLFRHVARAREAEVLKAAVSAGGGSDAMRRYIEKTAPWMSTKGNYDHLEKVFMSDDVQNARIKFKPVDPQDDIYADTL